METRSICTAADFGPEEMKNLIKKYVEIDVGNKATSCTCSGWVQSIDPVSHSFILLKFPDEQTSRCSEAVLVPGYNIKNVQILDQKIPSFEIQEVLDNIFRKKETYYSKKDLEIRRESLCVWFSNNRVPYTITSDLSIEVLQAALIMPPYSTDSIRCKNEVVLDKVMKLVSSAPGIQDNNSL